MLNPFPTLLIYGVIAPLLIRVTLGALLLYLSAEHFRSRREIAHLVSTLVGKLSKGTGWYLAGIELITGAALVVGLYTQIAAIVVIVLALKCLMVKQSLKVLSPLSRSTYLLMIVMALSLLLSGAGAFAFDLPL